MSAETPLDSRRGQKLKSAPSHPPGKTHNCQRLVRHQNGDLFAVTLPAAAPKPSKAPSRHEKSTYQRTFNRAKFSDHGKPLVPYRANACIVLDPKNEPIKSNSKSAKNHHSFELGKAAPRNHTDQSRFMTSYQATYCSDSLRNFELGMNNPGILAMKTSYMKGRQTKMVPRLKEYEEGSVGLAQ
eukprot:gnl/Hemi2/16514_TR5520_c0_g1_i1.p1 gnl/Hemi2/16514_TR5520_c0_g1~~gnl/Hemi2/16514_TR5520_c0_g1_i1.p1  ORF type:complete len:203 (+),score=42.09 gnl/Hemi2/16514_TR5520_c0_g1_i1:60-611(+)